MEKVEACKAPHIVPSPEISKWEKLNWEMKGKDTKKILHSQNESLTLESRTVLTFQCQRLTLNCMARIEVFVPLNCLHWHISLALMHLLTHKESSMNFYSSPPRQMTQCVESLSDPSESTPTTLLYVWVKVDRSILAWDIPRLWEGDETLALRLQTLEALGTDRTHVILNRVGLTKLKTYLARWHLLYIRRNIVVLDFWCAFFT